MINSDMELHLSKLNNAENVLLIAMRDWVSSVNKDKDPRPFLGQAFGTAGILDACPMFDELMLLTAANAIRGMDITIVTSARTDEEGRALLREMGIPFRSN